MNAITTLNDTTPTLCLYVSGRHWDHFALFALNEINSGMYRETMGDITFNHKILYANASSPIVGGEAQSVFSSNYQSCHVFVGPQWTTQLSAVGEWAGFERKPIVAGGGTSPIFSKENFRYVSRTSPSELYVVKAFVELIEEYHLDRINVVYVKNEFGISIREGLIKLSKGVFKVEVLTSFESAEDFKGINDALDELMDSSTSVTFLSASSIEVAPFLNAAGKRGMHDTHLWLTPKASHSAVLDALNPSSTGSIWCVDYGEELTEESPLGKRYLAKDPTPHIEAQQFGLGDDYNTLSYWGAYMYDAVLVSAYALAAAENRSDGEQVLKAIHGLSLDNGNTGILQINERGDRTTARIPLLYVTSDNEVEQFAVYHNGTTDFLQSPMWPGGTSTQPLLIREEADGNRIGKIVGSVFGGAIILLLATLFIHYHRSKKVVNKQREALQQTMDALKERDDELKALKDSMREDVGSTKYGDSVDYLDTLIEKEDCKEEREKLMILKNCLIKKNDNAMYIPKNLSEADETFIMTEFAGMGRKAIRQRGARNLYSLSSTRNINKSVTAGEEDDSQLYGCLSEFMKLDVSKQTKLFGLLSFENLKKWEFNIFDVADIDEANVLLFVSWGVICSPYSQIAMAKVLRDAGVEEAMGADDFDGYDFTDLDLTIDEEKLINYIRLIQDGYVDTPYHNRIHAADVVQTLNSLLQMAGDNFPFDKEDMFIILLASVVHDVKHPGKNNAFQVNSFSELALDWNDISVLESEHAMYALKSMMNHKECQFITNAGTTKLHDVRKKIIDAVLHTDMSKHFASVSKIKAAAAGKSCEELEPNVVWEVLVYTLHMADISNPTKPQPMCTLWTDRCLEEFFEQGEKEREMGVPISPNCDRTTTKKPDSQIGFIKFVVKPAYEVLAEIIPDVKHHILPVIESNLMYWDTQKGLEEAKA